MAIYSGSKIREFRLSRGYRSADSFAEFLGVKSGVIYKGEDGTTKDLEPLVQTICQRFAVPSETFEAEIGPDELRPAPDPSTVVWVAFWNQPVEGGGGAPEVETERVVDYLAFDERWLKGAAPSGYIGGVVAVRVRRDSMYPDVPSGNVVLLDLGWTKPMEGGVFVVRGKKGYVIKELRKQSGRWIAKSRNPEDKEKPIQLDLADEGDQTVSDEIAGKVFWRCGKV